MRVVMTGAEGFLGWHTRVRLRALTDHEVIPVDVANWDQLAELVNSADAVIHFAGINRGPDEEVEKGNVRLARELSDAVNRARVTPAIVYANTIQAGNGTAYGTGKAMASTILGEVAAAKGAPFADVVLPNLFGEHGRPDYNSFVATFAHRVVTGATPQVQDREVDLLHVQDAARTFVEALDGAGRRIVQPEATSTSVATVLEILASQFEVYRRGDIPALPSRLHVNLFNTLRAAMFPAHYPMPLVRHTDLRGSLIETVRAHGSEGQTFVSTTVPGITRGQHFHLRKVERFVVVSGRARISLRKVLTDEVVDFDVDGSGPAIVDMPTLWAHKITNTGDSELTTVFWTNELFDPEDPDTYPEDVR
jgi:UDP-2-acetamido-2,6-beta-L-arabino-hexul-4-ose reductase